MCTFNNIFYKMQVRYPLQNINEYIKWGSTLKPICFNCKELQSEGLYFKAREITKKLEEVLNKNNDIVVVKYKL